MNRAIATVYWFMFGYKCNADDLVEFANEMAEYLEVCGE